MDAAFDYKLPRTCSSGLGGAWHCCSRYVSDAAAEQASGAPLGFCDFINLVLKQRAAL